MRSEDEYLNMQVELVRRAVAAFKDSFDSCAKFSDVSYINGVLTVNEYGESMSYTIEYDADGKITGSIKAYIPSCDVMSYINEIKTVYKFTIHKSKFLDRDNTALRVFNPSDVTHTILLMDSALYDSLIGPLKEMSSTGRGHILLSTAPNKTNKDQ